MSKSEKPNRVPVYSVLVRKNAHTLTAVTVMLHEFKVLAFVFGVGNIYSAPGVPIQVDGQVKMPEPSGVAVISDDERKRLERMYGYEPVDKVYGNEMDGKVGELIAKEMPIADDLFPYVAPEKAEAVAPVADAATAEKLAAVEKQLADMMAKMEAMEAAAAIPADPPADTPAADTAGKAAAKSNK